MDSKLLRCGSWGGKFTGPAFSFADVWGLTLDVSESDVFVAGFCGELSLFRRDARLELMHLPDSWTAGMRTW